MQYITDRKRAVGLGSAKSGTEHYWRQQVSGVALLVLVPLFLFCVAGVVGEPYEAVLETFSRPFASIVTALTLVVGLQARAAGQLAGLQLELPPLETFQPCSPSRARPSAGAPRWSAFQPSWQSSHTLPALYFRTSFEKRWPSSFGSSAIASPSRDIRTRSDSISPQRKNMASNASSTVRLADRTMSMTVSN